MNYRLQSFLLLAIYLVFFSCSDDENPADNFKGTQDVTITFQGETYDLKGGEYYASLSESNCDISTIRHFGNNAESRFSLSGAPSINRFTFGYNSTFNSDPVPVGQTLTNPYFFYFSISKPGRESYYVGALLGGQSAPANDFNDNAIEVEIENASVTINSRFSNGNERVVDGVRDEYPLEKVTGKIDVQFKDENNVSQNLSADFDLEGDNIVIEPDDIIITPPVDTGGSGSGGGDCGNLTYNGPTEGQIKQFCEAAQLYDCLGASTEKAYVCSIIADYGASCPYCN